MSGGQTHVVGVGGGEGGEGGEGEDLSCNICPRTKTFSE